MESVAAQQGPDGFLVTKVHSNPAFLSQYTKSRPACQDQSALAKEGNIRYTVTAI